MFEGNRVGIRYQSKPLIFANPFKTSQRQTQLYTTYRSPIHREGITSLEKAQQERILERIQELKNAGMYDDEDDERMFRDFGNLATFPMDSLPEGVQSIEKLEKAKSAYQKAQAANAGVLTAKQLQLKKLAKLLKERKKKEARLKAIEYLATEDELDQVPEEYKEEVENWYWGKLLPEEKKWWHFDSLGLNQADRDEWKNKWRDNYEAVNGERPTDDQVDQAYAKELELMTKRIGGQEGIAEIIRRQKLKTRVNARRQLKREKRGIYDDPVRQFDEMTRKGLIQGRNVQGHGLIKGWKAPRLYTLVIIDKKKEDLENRQELYRTQQTENRGMRPPNEMVNRAMPKTAEPVNIEYPSSLQIRNVIAHPFVFPRRKFFVKTGLAPLPRRL